jgi:hypothetical protein
MLNECIKNFRNAILSLAILSIFLVLVVIDMWAKVDATIKLEQAAISYQLINESAKDLIIPNTEDDNEYITLHDAGYSHVSIGLALAHMNYSFPLWFGDHYCQNELQERSPKNKKIIFEWLSWEISASPNECIYQSPIDIIPQLTTEKIIPERIALVTPLKVRMPYDDSDKYIDYSEGVIISLDGSLFSCLTMVDTPESEQQYSQSCRLEDAENNHAESIYLDHVGMNDRSAIIKESMNALAVYAMGSLNDEKLDELTDNDEFREMSVQKGDGPYFATLQLQAKHKKTGHEFLLTVDNVAVLQNRYNAEDKLLMVGEMPFISAPWFEDKQSSEDILDTLRELYSESTGQFDNERSAGELINWVQTQVLAIIEGKINAPFIGTPIPLSALLSIVLLIYAVLLAWTYHLSSVINGLTYEAVEVPWMLLLLKRKSDQQSLLRYIDLVLAACLLLMRAFIILLPSLFIFALLLRGDAISNYFLPNTDLKYTVMLAVTPLFLLASTIIYIEVTTIKKLFKRDK